VAIIVNVASKCGFTATNYKELAELHDQYAESKGLRILAFPCNQFNGQVRLTRVTSVLHNNRILELWFKVHILPWKGCPNHVIIMLVYKDKVYYDTQ